MGAMSLLKVTSFLLPELALLEDRNKPCAQAQRKQRENRNPSLHLCLLQKLDTPEIYSN
jgi:hypothetical protein